MRRACSPTVRTERAGQWRRCWLVVAIVLTWGGLPTRAAQPRGLMADVDAWIATVDAHEPGRLPPATRELATWPWPKLSDVLEHVKRAARPTVLLRAAAMYLDIAVGIDEGRRAVYPTQGRALQGRDGKALRNAALDSHVWRARWLVTQALQRQSATDDDRALAAAWFRTMTAVLARNMKLADLEPHLADAIQLLPRHPGVLFDAACQAEALAAPISDATRQSEMNKAPRAAAFRPPMRRQDVGHFLATAERRYRTSLDVDPSNTEARVRLGRVLARLRRTDEAIAELDRATASAQDPHVSYYAWLFLARAFEDAGRYDEALHGYAQAAARFPAATSPQLGTSRVNAIRGDLGTARSVILAVPQEVDEEAEHDPYWQYDYCAGRDADRIYEAFTRMVRRMKP